MVLAHLKLSPAPSSLAEVQHLLDSLRQLGAVEYFRVPRENSLRRFSPHCFVLFNTAGSRLSPFAEADAGLPASATTLSATLAALVALPRFCYIENDAEYAAGRTVAPFRHTLTKHALDLDGRFAVSPATSARHLCLASPVDATLPRLRKELRHNFQKFHKFDFVNVATGADAVRMVTPGDHAPAR